MARGLRAAQPMRVPRPHGGHPTREQKEAGVPQFLVGIEVHLSPLHYPINDASTLREAAKSVNQPVVFRGEQIKPLDLIDKLPKSMFPIESKDQFLEKLSQYFGVGHPLMERPPTNSKSSKP